MNIGFTPKLAHAIQEFTRVQQDFAADLIMAGLATPQDALEAAEDDTVAYFQTINGNRLIGFEEPAAEHGGNVTPFPRR